MSRVFVYGTLLADEIFDRVVGHIGPSVPAILKGYERRAIRRAAFPAVVPKPGSVVRGMLHIQVNERALKALDHYEGAWYSRETVRVEADGQGSCMAFTYVLRPQYRRLLARGDWSYDDFRQSHLRSYLATV
ncbi:gamma-glutamylcyclotransferase [Proteobacteria bacterium 005FR1]|nr:gamma-glutamylcyclotransferase [Proteobacteria bacterium 005FR1]